MRASPRKCHLEVPIQSVRSLDRHVCRRGCYGEGKKTSHRSPTFWRLLGARNESAPCGMATSSRKSLTYSWATRDVARLAGNPSTIISSPRAIT